MYNNNKNILSLLSLISLSLMFCLPFMVSYHKWPETNYYNQLVAIVLGLLSLIVFFKPTSKNFSFPVSALVPAGLSLILVLQWFSGIGFYWQDVMLGVLYLWWAMLVMFSVVRLKNIYGAEIVVQFLAFGLLLGGLFNVLVVFMQLFGADDFFWTFPLIGKNYGGNLAQVNQLTNYLSLSVISLIYLFLSRGLKLNIVCVLLVLILVALTTTGSRMSWLYISVITASFFLLGRVSKNRAWREKSIFILMVPLLYIVVQYTLPLILDVLTQSQAAIPAAPTDKLVAYIGQHSIRFDLIQEGFDMFVAHPFLGVGWGQFPWYDLMLADVYPNHRGFSEHSHNIFIQILAECGIFAFIMLLLGSVYWVLHAFKQQSSIEHWWVITVVCVIFAHSMLEYPLWYAYFLGVFAVVVALGDKQVDISLYKPAAPSVIAAASFIAFVQLIVTTTYQYQKIEYWVNAYPKLSKEQRFNMLNDMSDMLDDTLISEPLHIVLTRAYSILPRKQAPLKEKIAKYESILHYVQGDLDIYRYIFLLTADGQLEKASQFLKRAYARHPVYIKQFEKKLTKAAKKGNRNALAMLAEVQRLQDNKKNNGT